MIIGADPVVKEAELSGLQTFSVNLIAACKEKGISFRGCCAKASIGTARIYEMRDKRFSSRIGFYTLCNLALAVDCTIVELFTPREGGEASPQGQRRKVHKNKEGLDKGI